MPSLIWDSRDCVRKVDQKKFDDLSDTRDVEVLESLREYDDYAATLFKDKKKFLTLKNSDTNGSRTLKGNF